MVEVHGWFTVREAFREKDEADEELLGAVSRIQKAIEALNKFNLFATMLSQNGAHNLLINGNFNHLDNRWNEVIELVALVAKVAPGSFGVLHFHDDEDKCGLDNQFQAMVMKKGKLQTHVEQRLSPVLSELEE